MKKVMLSFLIVFVVFVLFAGFTQQQKIKNTRARKSSDVDVVNNGNAVGFSASAYDSAYNRIMAPMLQWNTFLGGSDVDYGMGITIDGYGNIYVTGWTDYITGSLVNPFGVEYHDVFVAKLDSNGVLQWLTFLDGDISEDIVTVAGYIYVVGSSGNDAFVAKLNSKGSLKWRTLLGGKGSDQGYGIAVDNIGMILVTGVSDSSWGKPVNPFAGERDVFVAKLGYDGKLYWQTFLGGSKPDTGTGIIVDVGNVYVTGGSYATWGTDNLTPVLPFNGGKDVFVAKLTNYEGVLQWYTFLGGPGYDNGEGIVTDGSGNIYVSGWSTADWGFPAYSFGGGVSDAFVARLNPDGVLRWNTFLGGSGEDACHGIALSGSGNIYVPGFSTTTWGSPVNPFSGGDSDAFVAKLNSDGARNWNTFLGGSSDDRGNAMAIDSKGNLYVTGWSSDTWGTPVNPFAAEYDAFVTLVINDDPTPPYKIDLDKFYLNFGVIWSNQTTLQTFQVSSNSSNPGVPKWWITGDQPWISYTPTNGSGPGLVTVSVNPTGVPAGTYTGVITVSDPNAVNSPQTINVTFNVYSPGQTSKPFGYFETPVEGSLVSSSVPFTGWALDDIGVESVKIYLVDGSTSTYIGDAVFIEGARPDVELAYPGFPMNYRAGWGYMMLTNFLPNSGNGTFTIAAIATDLEGNQVTLDSKTITVDNANAVKPFGAIDTPGQGGTASGSSFRNWGWVLTPQPNLIPTNGSTIGVWVDGVNLGHPTYNIYRPDVAALFPGYGNTNGAGGYFDIDTTAYTNGVHSISWTATDSGGNTDGMGSRYFSILNTGISQLSAANTERVAAPGLKDIIDIPLSYDDPVKLKKGYNDSHLAEEVLPDADGIVPIRCQELERIELRVSHAGNKVEGYLVVGQRLKRLPIGSTLESRTGKFSWIPGPGFIGTYRLVFVETDGQGEKSREEIMVMIVPRGSRRPHP
jgi:hypothetical protein